MHAAARRGPARPGAARGGLFSATRAKRSGRPGGSLLPAHRRVSTRRRRRRRRGGCGSGAEPSGAGAAEVWLGGPRLASLPESLVAVMARIREMRWRNCDGEMRRRIREMQWRDAAARCEMLWREMEPNLRRSPSSRATRRCVRNVLLASRCRPCALRGEKGERVATWIGG